MSILDFMSQQQSPSLGGTGGIGALGAGNSIYPQSRMDKTQYATPMQLPTSAEVISSDYDPKIDAYTGMPSRFAKGGEVEGDSSDIDYRIMALSANPKYDPRYMPLRVDDRPTSDIQAAILRLQAEKQIGEGTARAGVAGLLGAIPGRHGVSALPGAYDIGYRTPVGSGDLDVSAYRAMKAMPDGRVPQGVRASYTVPFAEGGIAKFETGGGITDILANSGDSTEAKKATITKLYQNILGRDPKEGEDIMQWADSLDTSNPTQSVLTLADRLAQTEEGTEYGKKNPKEVFKTMAALSQSDSPFAGMDTPYSNMRYIGASNKTNYGGETTPDSTSVTHMFQDENGGVVSVDQYGQPTQYAPGRGWYDEQFKKHPDALRNYGYRNQTYLASGPLDKTYNINGVDVPVLAQEYQVDPKTGKMISGKTGDYKPLELKPEGDTWLDDWRAPAAVVAIPLAASVIAPAVAGAAAGTAAGGAGTISSLGAGGSFVPAAGNMAGFGIVPGATYTAAGAGGLTAAEIAAGTGNPLTSGLPAGNVYGPTYAEMGYQGANAKSTADAIAAADAASKAAAAGKTMTTGQKLIALNLATKALGGASGSGGGGGYTTTQSAPTQSVSSSQFQPSNYMPAMFAMNQSSTPGSYYQPYIYNYGSRHYAQGGVADLGGYAAGGKLLRGAGDGMSDDIVANIEGQQPARLADGEFVIPADVVSHLGNGSTDAGAKQLYKMMDKIRKARTGNKKQGKRINPEKFFPKG